MGRVVAIAGGDLVSNRSLNQHAIKLTRKESPAVLYIGTASCDALENINAFTEEYFALGCEVKTLCLVSGNCEEAEIDQLLSWADLIYVGGGDTISMMKIWKKHGLDRKLQEIYRNDAAVLTGISAGAICWFHCGHSDSESFHKKEGWNFCWADGMLDFFPMAYCPHYDEDGRNTFDAMLREKNIPGLALENNTAFVENNGNQYFIRSDCNAKGFIIRYTDGTMDKQPVEFEPVSAPLL